MKKTFFIMMNHPVLISTPIVSDDERVTFFMTEQDARIVAEDHAACRAYGYEIFELGTGC